MMLVVLVFGVFLILLVLMGLFFRAQECWLIRPLSNDSYIHVRLAVEGMPDNEVNRKLQAKVAWKLRVKPFRLTNEEVDAIMPFMDTFDLDRDTVSNRKYKIARQELLACKK